MRRGLRLSLSGLLRRLARVGGPRLRQLGAQALVSLPARRQRRGRVSSRLASARIAGLSALGRDEDARRFALERVEGPDMGARLVMAAWLADHGAAADALAVVAQPLPQAAPRSDRRAWQLIHARAARAVGRYAEAAAALDSVLAQDPTDSQARAERDRVDQIVERYTVVPEIPRPRPSLDREVAGRVLHLVEASSRDAQSGYTIRTHHVATAQKRAGLDPRVLVVGAAPGKGASVAFIDGVEYRWLPGAVGMRRHGAVSWTELASRAGAALEELHPAVLHAATPPTVGNLGRSLARWSGLPLVYEVRGFRDEFWRISHAEDEHVDHAVLSRRADSACMLEADAVVTLGEQMKAEVVERGIRPDRVWIVPNAVDTAQFRPGPRDHALALSYGVGRDEVVIGYISSFQPYEDFSTLVEAIGILRSRGRSVRGLLIGDGSTRVQIVRQVKDLGLERTITLPGRIPHAEVARHHRLIDIFVVPRVASRLSQLVTPLKPLEAMASGRALVVSRLDALMEAVIEGRTGVSFEAGDAADLASVLERLVLDPAERQRLGHTARAWVELERTLDRNGQRYREMYERLGIALTPA